MVYEIRCAWCEKHMGIKKCESNTFAFELREKGAPIISHGICTKCREYVLSNIEIKRGRTHEKISNV